MPALVQISLLSVVTNTVVEVHLVLQQSPLYPQLMNNFR